MQAAAERSAGVANQFEQFGIFPVPVLGHEHCVQAGLLSEGHSQCEIERRAAMSASVNDRKDPVERTLARPHYLLVPRTGHPAFLVHEGRLAEARRYSWIDEVRTYRALSVAPLAELSAQYE